MASLLLGRVFFVQHAALPFNVMGIGCCHPAAEEAGGHDAVLVLPPPALPRREQMHYHRVEDAAQEVHRPRTAYFFCGYIFQKVFFLLCHWGFDNAPGLMTKWAYKNFLIGVGLYDNLFLNDFYTVDHLSTDEIWYKNAWELCRHLGVTIELDKQFLLSPVCVRNW